MVDAVQSTMPVCVMSQAFTRSPAAPARQSAAAAPGGAGSKGIGAAEAGSDSGIQGAPGDVSAQLGGAVLAGARDGETAVAGIGLANSSGPGTAASSGMGPSWMSSSLSHSSEAELLAEAEVEPRVVAAEMALVALLRQQNETRRWAGLCTGVVHACRKPAYVLGVCEASDSQGHTHAHTHLPTWWLLHRAEARKRHLHRPSMSIASGATGGSGDGGSDDEDEAARVAVVLDPADVLAADPELMEAAAGGAAVRGQADGAAAGTGTGGSSAPAVAGARAAQDPREMITTYEVEFVRVQVRLHTPPRM